MHGGGEAREIVHAPDLAEVQRRIVERQAWLREDPVVVEPQLWSDARRQHAEVLEARGWPISVNGELERRGVPHFLVMGVPVVMENA